MAWKEDWEGDIASGPLTEPFPRRRPTDIISSIPQQGSPLLMELRSSFDVVKTGWSFTLHQSVSENTW